MSLLSPDERDRAQRFRFDKDQISFIVCRATLRALLAQYSSRLPADIQFLYSEYGRPALPQSTDAAVVEFNVSHSDEIALLAFARGFRIGIDVEKVRSDFNPFEIAERFFSSAERKALSEVPANEQHEAFFRCWTRKEAFIKALGEVLSHPLDQFDVPIGPENPEALLATRPDEQEVRRWMLADVSLPDGYAAALVAELPTHGE